MPSIYCYRSPKRSPTKKRSRSPKKSPARSTSYSRTPQRYRCRQVRSPGSRRVKSTSPYRQRRPGPPYAAADYRGERAKGNNGEWYRSLPDKNGRYFWKKI